MRSILYFALLSLILSSCAIYTQSNVENVSKKREKDLSGTFTPIDHLDVTDGYAFGMVATPLLVAYQDFSTRGTTIPLGLQTVFTQEKLGELNGHLFYMTEGFSLPKKDGVSGVYSDYWRIKPRIIYSHWIWKRVETINQYKIDLGRHDTLHYTAILPVNVSIELVLRGGYDKQYIEFISPSLNQYMDEKYPTNMVTYPNRVYHQMNSQLKFGLAFQRKMATTFDAIVNEKKMKAMEVSYKSLYFDVAYLIQSDDTPFNIEGDFLPYPYRIELTQPDIMPSHPFGFCFGFQSFTRPDESKIGASMHIEFGISPGNYDKMLNGFYGKFGFSLGIFPSRFKPRRS